MSEGIFCYGEKLHMVRNVCACPVLATISSSKCEKRNCSQITYKFFFCTAPKINQQSQSNFHKYNNWKRSAWLAYTLQRYWNSSISL